MRLLIWCFSFKTKWMNIWCPEKPTQTANNFKENANKNLPEQRLPMNSKWNVTGFFCIGHPKLNLSWFTVNCRVITTVIRKRMREIWNEKWEKKKKEKIWVSFELWQHRLMNVLMFANNPTEWTIWKRKICTCGKAPKQNECNMKQTYRMQAPHFKWKLIIL